MNCSRRALLLSLAGLASSPSWSATTPMGQRLMEFLAEVDAQDLALNPQAAVLRGDLKSAGQFGDLISDDYFRAAEALLREQLRAFAAIDRAQLAGHERVAYDMWQYQAGYALRQYDEGFIEISRRLPIDHLLGQHLAFAQFSSGSAGAPYRTLQDYADGLSRFDGFVIYLDRAIGRMREGMRERHVLLRGITEKVIVQLDEALALAAEASPFFGPIKLLPESFGAADCERLRSAYREAIVAKINPALTRLRDFMRSEYLAASRSGAPGLGALPGGTAYYEYQLEAHTTLRMSAGAIHRLGLSEVARIRGQMQRIRKQVGFGGTLAQFFEHLKTDAKFKFASKDALLGAYKDVGQRVNRALPRLFAKLPTGKLEFAAVPAEQENSASGAYYIVGTPDGDRPGVFYVNTSELPTRTSVRLTALYLHEAMPGHHLQACLAQEDTGLPPTLRFAWNTGYGEGWALYAEWLGHEMGLYDDPVQHFGQLDMEIFRAARMVVDTGLHAKGWSRERAIRFMEDNTSLDRPYIELEVDRYIVWPGQAPAYKLGELKIRALRHDAERALGARFDVRAFHEQVLNTGAVPLHVLERKIKDWVRSTRR
jgi:uncharacterized protein (DUF885 family)